MSQANVEIVRRCFDAFIRGDFEEAMQDFFRESGRGKGSGVRIEQSVAGVWTLYDGKVARVTPFLDRSEALEAVGLRE